MKHLIYIILLSSIAACNKEDEKHFYNVKGNWQITAFYHKQDDLTDDGYFLLGFDEPGRFWMTKREGHNDDKFIVSKYNFSTNRDTLKLDITKTQDIRIKGGYDVHIDTLQKTSQRYLIQLTLDSEDTYIQAIRDKISPIASPHYKRIR